MANTICLIPGRKGSKRLPRKNVAPFCGRPLGAWTFDFARQCRLFDRVILSTDDPELEALTPAGIDVLPRPSEFADDEATLHHVIKHVIADCRLPDDDSLVLTPVTAPLRTEEDLERTLQCFEAHARERTVITTSANPHPPHLLWTSAENGVLSSVVDRQAVGTRKQAFRRTFFWSDAFLMDSVSGFMAEGRDLYSDQPVGVEMPPERSVPIDTSIDLWIAEQLFRREILGVDT